MIFGVLNPEKIWHQQFVHLPTSPVYCSHFTLGNPKTSFFNSIIHTYFRLFTLSQKKTNCYPLTHHTWKMSSHYLVKCAHFSFFSNFYAYRLSIRDTDESQKRCDVGRILAELGERCNWSVAKKTGSMYLCRSWSLWTFAVMLLAWHSICHASQSVPFRATNANPQPAFFRATNIWRNATYLQSDEKVVHFTR